MSMSAEKLARKMYLLAREVDRHNAGLRAARLAGERAAPDLPEPAMGSYPACADYVESLGPVATGDVHEIRERADGLMASVRKASPGTVQRAWDLAMVRLLMER